MDGHSDTERLNAHHRVMHGRLPRVCGWSSSGSRRRSITTRGPSRAP